MTPNHLFISWNTCDKNCGPLSDIIFVAFPYIAKTFLINRSAVPSASIVSLQSIATIVLVNWSVMTRIESYLFDNGSFVIKSVVIYSNGHFGISVGCSGICIGCVIFFVSWHIAHPST